MIAPAPQLRVGETGCPAGGAASGHVLALDGIRALALVAVLLYHGQVSWMPGGFLGVSVFFTLSGYLITSLVLREHATTGRIDLVAFWGRRVRRLAPAALVTLGAVVCFGVVAGISDAVLADIRAAVLYVANWWSLLAGASYAELFAEPSPTEHFWSLAIEEQFYLLFPVVAWALLRGDGRRARRRFALVLGALAAGSVAVGLVLTDANRIYLGTDTRAAELLAGALLAFVWPLDRAVVPTTARARRLGTVAGAAALVGLVVLCVRTDLLDEWLYAGGLASVSLVSVTLVAAATRPGPLADLLSWRPLVRIGAVSYGMYLFHWPIYLVVDQASTGLSSWPLLALRLAITWLAAEISYRLIEQPVRLRRMFAGAQLRPAVATAMVVVLAGTVLGPQITARPDEPTAERAGAVMPGGDDLPEVGLVSAAASGERVVADATTTTTAPPPVIAFAGDSVPALLVKDIAPMAAAEFGVGLLNLGIEACDGARGAPELRIIDGQPLDEDPACARWAQRWPALFDEHQPRALVLLLGGAAVLDRRVDGRWTDACQDDFARWYTAELDTRLDWLARTAPATTVYLATSPRAEWFTMGYPLDHQDRTTCLNALYDEVAARHPGVRRLDAETFVCPDGPDECRPLRQDGVHYRGEGAVEFGRWALQQVTAAS